MAHCFAGAVCEMRARNTRRIPSNPNEQTGVYACLAQAPEPSTTACTTSASPGFPRDAVQVTARSEIREQRPYTATVRVVPR